MAPGGWIAVVPELRVGGLEPLWWVAGEVAEGKSWLYLGVSSRGLS